MLFFEKKDYRLTLNEHSGTVDTLAERTDMPGVTLAHKEAFSAFGSLCVTPCGKKWERKDTGSPIGVQSYVFQEQRYFALLEQTTENSALFRNPHTGHTVEYTMRPDSFTLRFMGNFPEADQIAVDLNLAFADLRQNEPRENQFTFQSFYADSRRELGYVYAARIGHGGRGLLLCAPRHCCGWRLRYEDSPYIPGLQFVYRFSEQIDPVAEVSKEVDFTVEGSFHNSLEDALTYMADTLTLPLLVMPVKAAFPGEELRFQVRMPAEVELIAPDGTKQTVTAPDGSGKVILPHEGFYTLTAKNESGQYYELILHCAALPLEILKRDRQALVPIFRLFNAENQAWVQGMLQAKRLCGNDERMELYLHDFLSLVGMQGRPDIFPGPIPSHEDSLERLERRHPEREHYTKIDGLFRGAPSPHPFEFDGLHFPAGHIWKWQRVQDGFAFIQTYLYAARAYRFDPYYEYAVEIARAHLKSHQLADGRIGKYSSWEKSWIDYTTVISPLLSVAELYEEMKSRNDSRAEEFGDACVRMAEYLLKRGMDFPTEGIPVQLRWTEDGSISCTALSLLAAYLMVKDDPRYLRFAEEVLAFHDSWHIRTNDVRSCDTTFRFWETQWENEGEGHSINCGHAWNLWRGEAMFYLGVAKRDPKAFQESWNTFQAVLCNHHPDGEVTSCFTPDYIPERPRRLELYHKYPPVPGGGVLAYHVWSCLARTWFKAGVLYEDPEFGVRGLNGLLTPNGEFVSYAPEFTILYDLRKEK